nr:immunoglobulin light chain junction region [Macaca mulatta]MOV77962.1 immunoglobulin light chain junction region [Macaca mulatta]MOV78697.1 immunoglobulin light chain junction region [Macaca mulatta]MOV79475.1 immunoglobulin light chain junction region [Macaca mulatta]MOV79668.1 immunoglobulin light chain junction region [Macaca mulatta]
CQQVLTNPAF